MSETRHYGPGSDEGAENWAMLASLIETRKLHGINPHAYLTDVLTKLVNNWPNRRLSELLPWAWTPLPLALLMLAQVARVTGQSCHCQPHTGLNFSRRLLRHFPQSSLCVVFRKAG